MGEQIPGRKAKRTFLHGGIFPLWLFAPCKCMKCPWRCVGRGEG